MLSQGYFLIECLPIILIFLRFLPSVDSLMYNKVGATTESFTTFTAFIEFPPMVEPLMLEKYWTPVELAALRIVIGFLLSVDSLMLNQDWIKTETFPVLLMCVNLHHGWCPHSYTWIPSTVLTFKGFLLGVTSLDLSCSWRFSHSAYTHRASLYHGVSDDKGGGDSDWKLVHIPDMSVVFL